MLEHATIQVHPERPGHIPKNGPVRRITNTTARTLVVMRQGEVLVILPPRHRSRDLVFAVAAGTVLRMVPYRRQRQDFWVMVITQPRRGPVELRQLPAMEGTVVTRPDAERPPPSPELLPTPVPLPAQASVPPGHECTRPVDEGTAPATPGLSSCQAPTGFVAAVSSTRRLWSRFAVLRRVFSWFRVFQL